MQPNLIPAPDPNPLPAPFWLFKLLLVVTFFLHVLVMNTMFGGAFLALVARWRASRDEYAGRLFLDLASKLPPLLAATITLGIAPLLFVQVLYGQFFYTSSILMAWPWFLLLVCLVLAYYSFYCAAAPGPTEPARSGPVLLGAALLIAAIAFLQTTNATLSQTPAAWAAKYFSHPNGWNLNVSEPTLVPRLLHFLVAAVAVAGLALAAVALRYWNSASDSGYARYAFRVGARAFLFATMAQFCFGLWFLAALPTDQRMIFLGGDPLASACIGLGAAAAIGLIFAVSTALHTETPHRVVYFAAGATAVVIFLMVVARDRLRDAALQPYFHPGQFAERTQFSTLPLFLVLFGGGVALWVVMLRRFSRAH